MMMSEKLDRNLSCDLAVPTPRYRPKRNEDTCPHKDLYVTIHRSWLGSAKWKLANLCQLVKKTPRGPSTRWNVMQL